MECYFLRIFLSILGGLTAFQCPSLSSQQPGIPASTQSVSPPATASSELSITVVAGNNGVNIVKEGATTHSVVEVLDENNRPVPGAIVNFTSPDFGPSVLFPNGRRTFSAVAETNGRAAAEEIEPVGTGPFKLSITAENDGRFASAQIAQTNYLTYADAERAHPAISILPERKPASHTGLSRGAIAAIIVGVAAAAGAGALIATRNRGSKSSSQAGSITVGTPTVGAPH